jgi:hypothetical protein
VQPLGKPDVVKLDTVEDPKVTFVLAAVTVPETPWMVAVVAAKLLRGPVVLPVTALAARVKMTVPTEQLVRTI